MPDSCIKRRLLFACDQAYRPEAPDGGRKVGWTEGPAIFTAVSPHGPGNIDCALVGRIAEGIVIAFRGTLPPFTSDSHGSLEVVLDWLNNVELISREKSLYPGRVHKGFAHSVDQLWPKIEAAVAGLVRPGGPNRLFITGHSKGGALANLAAWRALSLPGIETPIRVVTVAAARAGNEDFRTVMRTHGGIDCTRYESALDAVPLVPFGADTPGWAKGLARIAWPDLRDNNYVPVGDRVPARTGVGEAWQAVRRYAGWPGFGGTRSGYMPLLASAHSIARGSGYDALICDGEGGCRHV